MAAGFVDGRYIAWLIGRELYYDPLASAYRARLDEVTRVLHIEAAVAGSLTWVDALTITPAGAVSLGNGGFTVLDSTATGTVNNWAPGLAGNTIILWHGAADLAVIGLAGGTAGQIVTFRNTGTKIGTFAHNSGSSACKNSATSAPTPVAAGGWVSYQHDGTAWQMIGHEQGAWITTAFDAANFVGNGAMVWDVEAADAVATSWRLSGVSITINLNFSLTSTSGVANAFVKILKPVFGGFNSPSAQVIAPTATWADGGGSDDGRIIATSGDIFVGRRSGAVYTVPSVNTTSFSGVIPFPVT
jgi:hypothetical protein